MVSNAAIIVLAIVGAGAALMMGYAIGTKLWNGSPDDRAQEDLERNNDFNQAAYMRDVRMRNQDKIFAIARTSQVRPPQGQPTPVSYSAGSNSEF